MVKVVATATGYNDASATVTVAVSAGGSALATWTGYTPSTATFGGATPTLNAPGGAPQGVSVSYAYASTTMNICTVNSSSGALTIVRDGTCTITLTASATNYSDTTINQSITINKGTMSGFAWSGYAGNNAATFPNAPAIVAPTGMASGATLTYSTTSSTVCSVNSSTGALTLSGTGSCVVKVVATATGYNDASATVTVVVSAGGSALATWTGYTPSTATFGGATPTLNAPGGKPQGVSVSYAYASTTTNVCTVDSSGALTLVRDGTCTIRLTASATNYSDTTINQSITINKGTMSGFAWSGYADSNTATIPTAPAIVAPTGMASGATLTYSTVSSTVCSVNSTSGALALLGSGNCVVKVVAAATGYNDATVSVTVVVSAGSALATWRGYSPDTVTFGGATPTLDAPGGAPEGVSVTYAYASKTTSVCTVGSSSGALTIVGSGACTITLTASATGRNDLEIDRTVTVNPGTINLAWTGYSSNSATYGGTPPTLTSPTVTPSGATLEYSTTTTDVCTVGSSTGALTIVGSGTCTVTLTASATHYNNATRDATVMVNSGAINLAWTGYSSNSATYGGNAPTRNAPTVTPSGATLEYSTTTTDVCTVGSSTGALTIVGSGTCTVTLTASATHYNNASRNASMTVNPGTIDLAWTGYSSSSITYGDNAPTLNSPTVTPSGATLEYSTTTTDVCTVASATGALTIVGNGTCTVTLTASATHYNNATRDATVTVNSASTIMLTWSGYSPDSVALGEELTLSTPQVTPTDATLTYTSSTSNICTVDSSTGAVTPLDVGICTITLTASATGYADVTEDDSITFTQGTMTNLAWSSSAPSTAVIRGPFVYLDSFTGAPAGASYTYSTTSNNCSIDSSTGELWGLDLGTCRISVTAEATGYSNKTMTRDITVTRGSVAVAAATSCAILSDGQVKCWGRGDGGVLGRGNTDNVGDGANEMGDHLPSMDLGTGLKVKMLAGSNNGSPLQGHFCAVFDDGRIKCWGYNFQGQLGIGNKNHIGDHSNEMGNRLSYTNLGSKRTVKALSLGHNFSCAILDNNRVKCWGEASFGQLGSNNRHSRGDGGNEMGDRLAYVPLGSGRTAKDIEAGESHICALLDNDRVWCWGRNSYGQLGQGHKLDMGNDPNEMSDLRVVDLGTNRTAKRVSAGRQHTCAILNNNDLVCWGNNGSYKLGIDGFSLRIGDEAGEMGDNLSLTHLVSEDAAYVSLSNEATCVIKKNGIPYCWGRNSYGTLGLGHRLSRGISTHQADDVDVDLGSGRTAKIVQSGESHVCALLDNDDVKCWGYNADGQLGQGHTRSLGDGANEMGDNLAAVNLIPDMVNLAWRGYSANRINFNDTAPTLHRPTGAPAGATFAYSMRTSSICTVDSDGALTIADAGTCTIRLTASATDYRNWIKDFDITVSRANMTGLAWGGYASDSITYGDNAPVLEAPTGAPSGATFSYTTRTPAVCTVGSTNGALTIVGNGTCTVALTARAAGYNDRSINATVTVGLAAINLTWTGYSSNNITFGDSLTLNAPSATPSNASFSYTSRTTSICTVDSSSGAVTQVDDGVCTIRLTASADHYSDTTEDYNITIGPKAMGTLTWSGYSGSNTATFPTAPSLASSPSGAPTGASFSYASTTLGVCTVDDSSSGALSLVDEGTCRIEATASAKGYSDSTVSVDITINPGTITNVAWTGYSPASITFGDSLSLATPSATTSGVTFRYTSGTAGICTVSSSGVVTQVDDGTCTITLTASKQGYSDTTIDRDITILPATMSDLVWTGYANDNTANFPNDTPDLVDPTGAPSGTSLSYSTTTTNICGVNSQTGALTLSSVGTCTVRLTASKAGYSDKVITHSVNVVKRINFGWTGYTPSTITFGDNTPSLNAPTNVPGGATISYASTTESICTVDSAGALTILDHGSCIVAATASGVAGYSDTVINSTVTINPLTLTLTWNGFTRSTFTFGTTITRHNPSTTPSGATFTWTSSTTDKCTVDRTSGVVTAVNRTHHNQPCRITVTATKTGYTSKSQTHAVDNCSGHSNRDLMGRVFAFNDRLWG